MRILCVDDSAVVPSNRTHWERMTERYPDADVTLVCPAVSTTSRYGVDEVFRIRPESRADTFRVWPLPTTRRRRLYRGVHRTLRHARPDILQVNQEPAIWQLQEWFAAARLFAPSAIRLFYFETAIYLAPRRFGQRLKNTIGFRSGDALVPSRATEAVLRRLGFRRGAHVIPFQGRDERVWRPRDRNPRDEFVIGFSGSVREMKGVFDLVEAIAGLRGNWRLEVAGDGPDRGQMESLLVDRGCRQRATFLGYLDRETALPKRVADWDVLVLPSKTIPPDCEQFPMAVIEAMLCGTAVVVSDSGGMPELVGDAGGVFPEGDATALRDRLQELIDDRARCAEMGTRAYTRASNLYSATAVAKRTYELFSRLLEERRRRT